MIIQLLKYQLMEPWNSTCLFSGDWSIPWVINHLPVHLWSRVSMVQVASEVRHHSWGEDQAQGCNTQYIVNYMHTILYDN